MGVSIPPILFLVRNTLFQALGSNTMDTIVKRESCIPKARCARNPDSTSRKSYIQASGQNLSRLGKAKRRERVNI